MSDLCDSRFDASWLRASHRDEALRSAELMLLCCSVYVCMYVCMYMYV